jgi:hypothetical protein
VFAARFIGTPPMNIVAAPGRPALKLGVRPEQCVWWRAAASPAWCRAPSTSARHGGHVRDIGRGHTRETSRRGSPAATSWPRHERAPGWREEDSHWFDAASGLRRSDVAESLPVPA